MQSRARENERGETDARSTRRANECIGLRSQGLAPAGNRAALSNIGNMMNGAQGARQTRSSKAKYVQSASSFIDARARCFVTLVISLSRSRALLVERLFTDDFFDGAYTAKKMPPRRVCSTRSVPRRLKPWLGPPLGGVARARAPVTASRDPGLRAKWAVR